MPIIIEPESYKTEEIVRIPTSGRERCIAVSGYADFSKDDDPLDGHPLHSEISGGGENSDSRWFGTTVHMIVGPKWATVKDVSPVVNVAGISFLDSDETDDTGYEIMSCTWDAVQLPAPDTGSERIRLKVVIRMCGGSRSSITMLSYHLVAIGTVNAIMG